MPRYALIRTSMVENVILADVAPPNGVLLRDTDAVSPGDGYNGTVFTPRTRSDAELRAAAAAARLIASRAQLRQIRQQAQTASDATGALTLVQLTAQFRQLAGAVASLAQTLMDLELYVAANGDDGAE